MIKKINKVLLFVLLTIILCATAFTGCNNNKKTQEAFYLLFDGDIKSDIVKLNLNDVSEVKYSYVSDGQSVTNKGWDLNTLLKSIVPLYQDNYLMITGKDGTSVLLEARLTAPLYLYKNENGVLCCNGPDYPRSVGIKDIDDITFICKDLDYNSGYKVLSPDNTKYISRGNAKLSFFKKSAENELNGHTADKYLPDKVPKTIFDFIRMENVVVYFSDYDYSTEADYKKLKWENGGVSCEYNDTYKPIHGFASGADRMIDSVYGEIKKSIDLNEKVMFIETDGFSLQQANLFANELDLLKPTSATEIALSTHLSISPVALAAIATGASPFKNGVFFNENESRAVLTPVVSDIFAYAKDKNKSVSYIEGDGKLVNFSLSPVYGITDKGVYKLAVDSISKNTDFIFIHFHEIDDTNHGYGPLSTEARNKILEIQFYIKELIKQFDGKVIVTSDHGHNQLLDENNNAYGKHGLFTNLDMFVPYYVFNGD